jgi:hypothetical protein
MLKALFAIGTAAAMLAAPVATPAETAATLASPPPGAITIHLVSANGSGCRPGTTQVAAFEDNTGFTITYSAYTAQAGDHLNPVESRRNCQLAVLAHVPQGFTYAISQVTYRGYLQLERGAVALQKASYYFAGGLPTSSAQHRFTGPVADNWTVNQLIHTLVWAPCATARNLNINSELRVHAASRAPISFITMDSTDTSISTVYHLTWRRC